MTEELRYALQHRFNSMHVYCRLCTFIPHSAAIKLSRTWEKVIHPIIYPNGSLPRERRDDLNEEELPYRDV